jgi:hypothetical protein
VSGIDPSLLCVHPIREKQIRRRNKCLIPIKVAFVSDSKFCEGSDRSISSK